MQPITDLKCHRIRSKIKGIIVQHLSDVYLQ